MDLNKREEQFEKGQKQLLKLKESFKKIFEGSELLTEKKLVTDAGKKLLAKIGKLKEEDTEETKKDDVVVADEPKVDAPADEVPAPAAEEPAKTDAPADVVPAPVSVNAPEVAALNSQDQLATTEFVKDFLKGLPSDINTETSVDANGIFKASVNDQHEGQFTVVVYPASKNVHQVADLLEPALPTPAEVPQVLNPDGTPAAAPADTSALDVPPVAAPEVPPTEEVPVAPEEKKDDEMAENAEVVSAVCSDEHCNNEHCPVHGNMPCADEHCSDANCEVHGMKEVCCDHMDEAAELEKQRDPMLEGRKNWKSYQKMLLENALKKKITEEAEAAVEASPVEKLERRIKSIEDQIKNETDSEEKKALQIDLGKAKIALGKAKESMKDKDEVVSKYKGKKQLSDDSVEADEEK